jgi:glucose-6-phosphate 1-dehydrogenase
MVIFGASGDLARRKLIPALFNLETDGLLPAHFRVIGFGRREMSDEDFRLGAERYLDANRKAAPFSRRRWKAFAKKLYFVSGGYDDVSAFERLAETIGECGRPREGGVNLFYLALPPKVSETVLETMGRSGIADRGPGRPVVRVLLEKPFGLDLRGARRLNGLLAKTFDESQVYRVDHYLGKDTIRNLLVFRFANSIFEPVWNRRYIDNIQITASEDIGIEGRGGYYDEAGVVRDIIQNHVMQVLALVTMDPPLAGDAESVRDRKYEVFRSVSPIAKGDFVFGQYKGYDRERNVAATSRTPTFAALRLTLNNWRWFGVPVYIRAGKALAEKVTEVAIQFKQIPVCVLGDEKACRQVRPNILFMRIQPDEGMRLAITAKVPGRADEVATVPLDFNYGRFGVRMPNAYERVLLDCLSGVPTLFWRADSVEQAWRIVTPLLGSSPRRQPSTVYRYETGTRGPTQAERLIRADGRYWLLNE